MGQENLSLVIRNAISDQAIDMANVNMILPTSSFGALLGEYEKITLEVVRIDPDTKAGEVYEPNGSGKGKALSKVPLLRIANAVGLVWVPAQTTILESSERKARAKATASFRKANGEWIPITEEKTVDLDAIEEKLRIGKEEEADKGPIELDQYGKQVWKTAKNGKKHPSHILDGWANAAEKEKWIDREVRKSLIQYRLYKDERAMTGAKERVIRAVLAIKNTYTDAELSKPFAFPRIVADVSAMMRDPDTREAAIGMMTGGVTKLFGDTEEAKAPAGDRTPDFTATILPDEAPEGDDPFTQPPEPSAKPETTAPETPPEDEQRKDALLKLEEWRHTDVIQRNKGVMDTIDAVFLNENAPFADIKAMIDRCVTYAKDYAK